MTAACIGRAASPEASVTAVADVPAVQQPPQLVPPSAEVSLGGLEVLGVDESL